MDDLIEPKELYQQLNGERPPVVIDVRGPEAYRAGHIPGAMNIPGDELDARMADIPRNRPVVAY